MTVVVCPCEVTRVSTFPEGAQLIESLLELISPATSNPEP
jgi:hypothetical protein